MNPTPDTGEQLRNLTTEQFQQLVLTCCTGCRGFRPARSLDQSLCKRGVFDAAVVLGVRLQEDGTITCEKREKLLSRKPNGKARPKGQEVLL